MKILSEKNLSLVAKSVLVLSLSALMLAGCSKKEEPVPEVKKVEEAVKTVTESSSLANLSSDIFSVERSHRLCCALRRGIPASPRPAFSLSRSTSYILSTGVTSRATHGTYMVSWQLRCQYLQTFS